jgi:signal transduction histidine kinase
MSDPRDVRIAQLEAELANTRAQMQSLVATVSHDLRAPLRHITSYAQLVQEDAGPLLTPEVQGFVGTIVDSARTLGSMLDGLLELSRVGSAPLHIEALPLTAQVAQAQSALAGRAEGRSVEWHIADDLPDVLADAALLQKVLLAVLGNALQFTAGRTPAVIAVSAQPTADGASVVLTVKDNGVGFSAGPQARLFEPFQRLHSPRELAGLCAGAGTGQGTGLGMGTGLAIARKALERMGGSIAIEAQKEVGCTVRLNLPHAPQ